jgi:hypothetical protein
MVLMFLLTGALATAVGLGAYGVPAVREVERRTPDEPGSLPYPVSGLEPATRSR